jgi:hypothetical protein
MTKAIHNINLNPVTTESQRKRISEWFEIGHELTPKEARERFKCERLAARVKEIRDNGLDIKTEIINNNGTRFANYYLFKK